MTLLGAEPPRNAEAVRFEHAQLSAEVEAVDVRIRRCVAAGEHAAAADLRWGIMLQRQRRDLLALFLHAVPRSSLAHILTGDPQ